MYQCVICKKEYEDPVEMAKCTIRCDEKRKKEELEKRKRELIEQENERKVEIQKEFDNLCKLIELYHRDYQKPIDIKSASFHSLTKPFNLFRFQNMYYCLNCGFLFIKPKHYIEKHGLETPPYEEWYGCPSCSGNFIEALKCDGCGNYITTEEFCVIGDDKFCEHCFQIKKIGE